MTMARGKALSLALAVVGTAVTASAVRGERPTVRVGLVMDGPWVHNETYLPMFLGEIKALTADEFEAYRKKWPEDNLKPKTGPLTHEVNIRPHGPCILISDDGGDTWRLALTDDFINGMKAMAK